MQLYFYKIQIKYVRKKRRAAPAVPRRTLYRILCDIQINTTAQQITDAAPLNTLKQRRIIVKLQKIFSNIYFWTSEKLTVETQKIQDRYWITLADPTYVTTFDEVMKNILTTQNIHTEQEKAIKNRGWDDVVLRDW